MTSAYWMTDHQLASPALQETLHPAPASGDPERWPFLQWTQRLAPDAKAAPHLVRLLQVSGRSAFKIWCLSRPLIIAKWTMLAASLVAATWAVWRWSAAPIVSADVAAWARSHTVGHLALAAITMLGFLFLSHLARRVLGPRTGAYAVRLVRFRGTLRDVAVGVGMGLFGWIVAWGHLRVFDPLYLRYGSRKRIPM